MRGGHPLEHLAADQHEAGRGILGLHQPATELLSCWLTVTAYCNVEATDLSGATAARPPGRAS